MKRKLVELWTGVLVVMVVLFATFGVVCNWGCASTTLPPQQTARWASAGPVRVYADPDLPPLHRQALDEAVEEVDRACACRLLLRPLTGAPLLQQEISGAPDRGTIYVRDDGRFEPRRAHTLPYVHQDGRIFSVEVVLPREGEQANSLVARPLAFDELYRISLHELGHAVGLPHSTDQRSVFYPVAGSVQGVTAEDALALHRIYGGMQ